MIHVLLRLIAALYPRSFKDPWKAELERTNLEVLRTARARGLRRYVHSALWLLWDLTVNLLPAWTDARSQARAVGPAPRGNMLDHLLQDLRFGLRTMRSSPWFSAAAVLTLSLGIGGTVALFSVINGVLLRPLGYPEEQRLVRIEGDPDLRAGVTYPDYQLMQTRARSFDRVAVWQGWSLHLRDADNTLNRINGASVSANYFDLLGQRPFLGRFFTPEDDRVAHEPVVVLSHSAWRTYFSERPNIIGQTIQVDTGVYRVIGVAQPEFADPLTANAALWRAHPAAFERGIAEPTWIGFWCIARLRPDASVAQARVEVRQLIANTFSNPKQSAIRQVTQFRAAVVRTVRPTLIALLAAVVLVLLIGCANVANLLLSRATVRANEVAVRTALGASRSRVISQLLTEGVLLSLFATAAGLLLANVTLRVLLRTVGAQLPRSDGIGIDWRVTAFAIGLTLITALLFAVAPALQLARLGSIQTIRGSGRGIAGNSGRRLRQSLVVLETACALMLLAGAGLLGRTLLGVQRIRPGFDASAVLYTRVGFPPAQFSARAQQDVALARVLEDAAQGNVASGAISDLPMSGAVNSTSVQRMDRPVTEEGGMSSLVRATAGQYFRAMGVPIVQGRDFSAADRPGSPEVALVNQVFAQRMFGGENPLGRVVLVRNVPREIIGVVGAVKEFTLTGELEPALYTPYAQEHEAWMRENMTVVLRGNAEPRVVYDAIRGADPSLTVSPPKRLVSIIDADVAAPRSRALLLSIFAGIALVLAAAGIGSVLAYSVAQRLPELGLRMAVGAGPSDVLRLVLGESASLTGAGLALGTAGALVTGRLLSRFLYGVSPVDPLTLIGAITVLLASALAAAWIPARRGARTDPGIVLRGQ